MAIKIIVDKGHFDMKWGWGGDVIIMSTRIFCSIISLQNVAIMLPYPSSLFPALQTIRYTHTGQIFKSEKREKYDNILNRYFNLRNCTLKKIKWIHDELTRPGVNHNWHESKKNTQLQCHLGASFIRHPSLQRLVNTKIIPAP